MLSQTCLVQKNTAVVYVLVQQTDTRKKKDEKAGGTKIKQRGMQQAVEVGTAAAEQQQHRGK